MRISEFLNMADKGTFAARRDDGAWEAPRHRLVPLPSRHSCVDGVVAKSIPYGL